MKHRERTQRQTLIAFWLGVPLFFSSGCSQPAPPPVTELHSNETLDRDVRVAIQEHLHRVRAEPQSPERRSELAMLYEANKLWHVAAEAWAAALQLDPEHAAWIYHRSICLRQAGHTSQALAELQRSVAMDGGSASSHNDLGTIWLEEGNLQQATEEFEAARKLAPRHAVPLVGLAEVRLLQGQAPEAIQLCAEALALSPECKRAHYVLGLAYRESGRTSEARRELSMGMNTTTVFIADDIERQLKELGLSYTLRLARALSFQAEGQLAQSAAVLEEIIRSRPRDVTTLNNLSSVLSSMGQFDQALEHARLAQSIEPEDFSTCINASGALLGLGQTAEAVAQANRAVSLGGSVGYCYLVRARALLAQSRKHEAYVDLKRAVVLDATQQEAHAMMGQLAMDFERFEDAVQHFRDAIRVQPEHFGAHARLVLCLLKLDRRREALTAFRYARALAPDHPDIAFLTKQLGL